MPDISLVHVDMALTNVSIAYRNAQFVADRVFPIVPVNKQSNRYFVYSKDRFRALDDARRPGSRANEIDWALSSDTYYADGHALAQVIPDELRANQDPALDIDVDTTEALTDVILLNQEIAAAGKVFDPAVITQNVTLSGTSQWSDYSNSDPVKAVDDQKQTIFKQIGMPPNSLLVSYPTFVTLRNHPKIIDRFKYAQVGILLPEHLRAAFDVENFIIGSAVKQTAAEGQADALDYVWGKHALLFYSPAQPGRRVVALGYQFTWLFGASTQGFLVKRYRDETRTADVIEAQRYYDAKPVAPQAGFLFINATA